jgi:hypothetical protein
MSVKILELVITKICIMMIKIYKSASKTGILKHCLLELTRSWKNDFPGRVLRITSATTIRSDTSGHYKR